MLFKFDIDVNVRFLNSPPHADHSAEFRELREIIFSFQEIFMATQAEVTLKLNETLTVLRKVAGEVSGLQAGMDALNERIAELLAIIAAGGDASPDLVAKANEVQDAATGLDAQIPDPIVVPTA